MKQKKEDTPVTPQPPLQINRQLGNWMAAKFKNPNLSGYWATKEDITFFKNLGYELACPEDIQDFDRQFTDINPGEALSPEGMISYHSHTLLKVTKARQKQVEQYFYKQRELYKNKPDYLGSIKRS